MRHAPLAIAVWIAGLVGHSADGVDDQRFLDGLRSRGLYELAEKHCAEQLADARITDSRRAGLTIELSRTLAEHALAAGADAPRLWQLAQRVVEDFAAKNPRHPQLLLVRLQAALAMAAHGESAREEAESSSDPKTTEAARTILRGAIAALNKLSEEIAEQLTRSTSKRGAGELSPPELQSLEVNVRYELARAFRNQALCYPSGTADRINSLSLAIEQLATVTREDPRTSLAWPAALAEIACLRLLGEYPEAQRRIERLEKSQPPQDFAERLRAERIRLALARSRIDEALSEAGDARQAGGAEIELARLEALLSAWQSAEGKRDAAAADFQRRAIEQVRAIQRWSGTRAARSAERLLSRALADSKSPQSADALAEVAAGYYRTGQMDKAVAAYDRAASRAREARQGELAFDLGLTAATIEKEQKHFRAALDRYRALATGSPGERKAGDAHLLAVYCAAQLAQAEQPPKLDEYEQLLRQHVDTWPTSRTASQAWVWLGRLAESKGAWQEAIQALRHVAAGDPQFADAALAIGRSYEAWLTQLHERGQNGERLADEALAWCEQVSPKRGKPNAATRFAALVAARVWLTEIPNGAQQAERLLSAALERDPDAPKEWKASAQRLLVASLAAQGKAEQADELLTQIPHADAADALALFETLSAVRRRARGDVHRTLAEMELAAADDVIKRRQQLDAPTLVAVVRGRAVTLAALGRRKEAIDQLQALARAFPRDGQTHEELAGLLMRGDDADLQAAVGKWTEVAKRSRAGTPRYFRAYYSLARTQLTLGQVAAARATIAAVSAKYPDFGGEPTKRQFDELSAELERPPDRASRAK
jgi:TolA-binding protein